MENNQERKRSPGDDQDRKQAARRVPFAQLEQVHSDFAIAMALQEQERAFNALTSIESDSQEEGEEEEDEDENESQQDLSSEENNGMNDYEYFESQELEFLETQDSNSDQDMDEDEDEDEEEDEIDPDELSYEELIALGEFIGEARTGLSKDEISKCLNPCRYGFLENKSGIDRCVICQVEYEGGEALASLLPCQHPYHSECITNWLQIKKLCPICSTEVSPSSSNISLN